MDEETTQHIIITVSRMWQSLCAVQASSSFPLPLCLTTFPLGNILLCVCVFSVCMFSVCVCVFVCPRESGSGATTRCTTSKRESEVTPQGRTFFSKCVRNMCVQSDKPLLSVNNTFECLISFLKKSIVLKLI